MGVFSPLEPLNRDHEVASFDCGFHALNDYLIRHALQGATAGSGRTFVAEANSRVVGYYTLVAASVQAEESTARVAKGMPRHPIGVVLLARLAVDQSVQGQGLGKALLKDALIRVGKLSEDIGVRALLVHAKSDEAKKFYLHFDFEPSPTDPLHLFLLLKDLRDWIRASGYI